MTIGRLFALIFAHDWNWANIHEKCFVVNGTMMIDHRICEHCAIFSDKSIFSQQEFGGLKEQKGRALGFVSTNNDLYICLYSILMIDPWMTLQWNQITIGDPFWWPRWSSSAPRNPCGSLSQVQPEVTHILAAPINAQGLVCVENCRVKGWFKDV